ncbi:MAG: DUF5063 domain-containing protein [Dysgonamonadaceae bacterium]|jgi:hypothetical protein|nr:DUF5063 domain-containing protein [Dysgonamonadaceae bacterium]
MSNSSDIIYSKPVIDFVTVGVEFCAMLESDEGIARKEWLTKMSRLLPMLYLKAALLPETLVVGEESGETFVREEDYACVAGKVARIMGGADAYLDAFVEDMKYSDTPVSAFISENIADIYQDIRNFVSVYQYAIAEQMLEALAVVTENFKNYWGQKLVNVLRPVHTLLYADNIGDEYPGENENEGGFRE